MSGIEVAGLVLAVLGALIKGVGGYNEVVTGRDVKLLVESLKDNKIMFSNSVEHLLRSIVPTDELSRLLNDHTGDIWRKHDLDQRVIAHLGEDAENITKKIDDIHRTLAQLQKKMPARKDDATVVARATHVIKCFLRGPHYKASLERLRMRVSEFRILIDDALKLAPARGVSLRTLQDLDLVEERAGWLHEALKAGWKCTCEGSHPANIQVEMWSPRVATDHDEVCFSLLFAEDPRQAQYDHWLSAEITTLRRRPQKGRPMLVEHMRNPHTSGSSTQSISATPLLTSSTSPSSLAITTTTQAQTMPGNAQYPSDDLCPIFKHPRQSPSGGRHRVGFISDKSGHKFYLFSRPDVVLAKPSMTLSEVYRKQSLLSNRNRVQLALKLAWGVLQISSTSWLKGKWTRENILLVMDAPNNPLPYLVHRFKSSRETSQLSSEGPQTTIYQADDWISNMSLFALGIFLLEMCFDCSIEDLATAREKDQNGDARDYTPFLTANRLSKLVQDQMGLYYAQAVNSCLNFPILDMDTDGKPASFPEFATIVMRDVISPLKAAADVFSNKATAKYI